MTNTIIPVSIMWQYIKMLITTTVDNIFFFQLSEKIRIDISCELAAKQTIRVTCRLIFSEKA